MLWPGLRILSILRINGVSYTSNRSFLCRPSSPYLEVAELSVAAALTFDEQLLPFAFCTWSILWLLRAATPTSSLYKHNDTRASFLPMPLSFLQFLRFLPVIKLIQYGLYEFCVHLFRLDPAAECNEFPVLVDFAISCSYFSLELREGLAKFPPLCFEF